MAEETVISWNVANWLTVILMAAIGFALLGLLQKVIASRRNGATTDETA